MKKITPIGLALLLTATSVNAGVPTKAFSSSKTNFLYGFKDKNGKVVIRPKFSIAGDFSEGLALAGYKKYGYIDTTGRFVIPQRYHHGEYFTGCKFSEGLACVQTSNGKWGFIDRQGKWKISPRDWVPNSFSESLAKVYSKQQRAYGYIDRSGNWVIDPKFYSGEKFSEGLAAVSLSFRIPNTPSVDLKSGFIDGNGRWIIEPIYSYTNSFQNGVAEVRVGEYGTPTWGLIKKDGTWKVQPKFTLSGIKKERAALEAKNGN